LLIPLPPLAEQQRIAALLDTADNLLRLREAAIDKLDQLANVAYEDLLQSSKVVIEELASDLFVFIRNGLNVKHSSETDGLPITRIETISHSNINLKKVGYAGLDAADCGNFILHDGDILFSHINSVAHLGKCALYDQGMGPLVHGMNLLCFRPNIKKLTPHFALFSIRSQFFRRQMAKSIKKAVNQASLSTGDLKKISLRVPSLEDQRKFSDFVLNIELRKRNMFQSKENLQTLIASMQQQEFSVN